MRQGREYEFVGGAKTTPELRDVWPRSASIRSSINSCSSFSFLILFAFRVENRRCSVYVHGQTGVSTRVEHRTRGGDVTHLPVSAIALFVL